MLQAVRALTWEYWRVGRVGFLVALAAMIGAPALILAQWNPRYLVSQARDADLKMAMILSFLIMGPTCLLAVLRVQAGERFGFHERLFTLPLPGWLLVAWRLVVSMITVCALYLISALLLNGMFGAAFPIWLPMLSLAAIVAAAHAVNWSTSRWQMLQIATFAVPLAVLASLVFQRNPSEEKLVALVALLKLVCGATIAISCGIAWVAVVQGRRGNYLEWARGGQLAVPTLVRPRFLSTRPFVSQDDAQFWLEWRRKGFILPAISGFGLLGISSLSIFGVERSTVIEILFYFGIWIFPVIVPCFLGGFFGRVRRGGTDKNPGISVFLATQPTTDSALAGTALKSLGCSLVLNWLVICITSAIGVLFIVLMERWLLGGSQLANMQSSWMRTYGSIVSPKDPRTILSTLFGGAALFLISWTVAALTAAMVLTGRPWVLATAILTIGGGMILFALGARYMDGKVFQYITECLAVLIGLASAGGTIWLFLQARRRGIVSSFAFLCAGEIWLLLSLPIIWMCLSEGRDLNNWMALFILVGFAWLVVLPIAAAPLAVAWNRHR